MNFKSIAVGMLIGAGAVLIGIFAVHAINDYLDYLAVQRAVDALVNL